MEGNQQKMRDALEWLLGFGYSTTDGGFHLPDAKMARNKIEAALSAPARNCDVGTDAEQAQRFERFCAAHHEEWKNGRPLMAWTCDCPCYQTGKNSCNYFTWAQMPYDAEAEGAK